MRSVDEAAAAVRAARNRLLVAAAADGAARGALIGALAGAAAWLVARWAGADVATWPLVGPVAGAAVGAAAAFSRGVAESRAALALDAAARTDEAFVSAIAATDAVPEMRALAADYAVARCPRSAVGRFLPVRAPGAASAAAVATALVAALVLVPRAAATERAPAAPLENAGEADLPAAPASAETSPRGRVDRLREAVARSGEREASSLAPAVRKDLGAVSTSELRKLAEALATSASSAEAARRAIAALDRGDRAAATAALREALGGLPSATTPDGVGSAKASATPPAAQAPGSWAGATWPLRYDRVVRRWIAETETR